MEIIEVILTLPPPLNQIWSTNRKGRFYKTNIAKAWQAEAAWEIKHSAKGKRFQGFVSVDYLFIPPDNRKRDIDSVEKLLFDAIEDSGIIENDYQINDHSGRRVNPDKKNPRLELKIRGKIME